MFMSFYRDLPSQLALWGPGAAAGVPAGQGPAAAAVDVAATGKGVEQQQPQAGRALSMLRTASAKESADREAVLLALADEFASKLTEVHFSTAQLQAFLMSHRRDPVRAVAKVGEWLAEQQAAVDREEKEQE
jgi:hypothetical protein